MCLGVKLLIWCVANVGCLGVFKFLVWIGTVGVGRDCKDFGAGFGYEEGDGKIRLVWGRYVEELYGWVNGFVYREDGATGAALGVSVVEGGVVD